MFADILAFLKTQPTVTAHVGSDPCKIFATDVPEQMQDSGGTVHTIAEPYVEFTNVGGDPDRYMEGRLGCAELNYQVSVRAKKLGTAETIYNDIRKVLGEITEEVLWGSTVVQESQMSLPSDVSIPPDNGGESSTKMMAGRLFIRAKWDG